MISPDNDFIFFTRKVDNTNLGNIANLIEEEFTLASRLNEGQNTFTYGERLPDPFNDGSFYNYGTATLSVDNKEMKLNTICWKRKLAVNPQTLASDGSLTMSFL